MTRRRAPSLLTPAALLLAAAIHPRAVALRWDPRAPLAAPVPRGATGPGEIAGGLLLGGFRGLFVDIIWLRAQVAMAGPLEGMYEVPALYEKLALLQPQYPEMWAATGTDMAVNAAARFEDARAQWPWIRRGVDWLRRGTERLGSDPAAGHPRGDKLWEELGWTYLNKCTPYNDEPLGRIWYDLAAETWGQDPFLLSCEAFRTAARYPRFLPARASMSAHVLRNWAKHTRDPGLELERIALADEEYLALDRRQGLGLPLSALTEDLPARRRAMEEALRETLPAWAFEALWSEGGRTDAAVEALRMQEGINIRLATAGRGEDGGWLDDRLDFHLGLVLPQRQTLRDFARAAHLRARSATEPDAGRRDALRDDALRGLREAALRNPPLSDDLPFAMRKWSAPPGFYRDLATALAALGPEGTDAASTFLAWADYLESTPDGG